MRATDGIDSPPLPDLPQNASLLGYLRERAAPPSGPHDYTLGGWQMHTHPDLLSRLIELAAPAPLNSAYGVPVLAHDGIAVAVAMGTDTLLVRLPAPPHDLTAEDPVPALTDHGWQAVDAWQGELPSPVGTRRLARLLREAAAHLRRPPAHP